MLGYKAAKHGDIRVLITLEIPEDALTNLRRPGIAFADTAMYRANKVKVLQIEDAEGNPYPSAEFYQFPRTYTFILGEMLKEPDFDPRLEEISAEGIRFFRSRRVAELYGLPKMNNGVFTQWHPNGQKSKECPIVNGQKHGLYQEWYENGQIMEECSYVHGKLEGSFTFWSYSGIQQVQKHYKEDRLHGPYQSWYSNGQQKTETTYVNGYIHGTYHKWYDNGQKMWEVKYDRSLRVEVGKSWYRDGIPVP